MNPFFKPAYRLMNRLSYRNKFLLIASLFAIPLMLFASQLAIKFHHDAQQSKLAQQRLIGLQGAAQLISNLETMRDISVITYGNPNSEFSKLYGKTSKVAISQIVELKNQRGLIKYYDFLTTLESGITQNKISPGNEGARLYSVFENASVLVEQAYLWQLELSSELFPHGHSESSINSIIGMVNNNHVYLNALGKARTLGSYFLQKKYLDGAGIRLLEDNFQSLTRLINNSELSEIEYRKLFAKYSILQPFNLKQLLTNARTLIDNWLIQPMSIDGDPLEFYFETTEIIQAFYSHNDNLLALSDTILKQKNELISRQLIFFYASVILMMLLLSYLYIGFFQYVRASIQDLVSSAERVANGEYEKEITIDAKDDLVVLAHAMDEMRQSIKVREDKLIHIGQTDWLTQLNNRKYFDKSLPIMLASSSRNNTSVSLVLMDIDHFKDINDQHGHQAGDECLQQIARLFKEQFKRKTDTLARYGGEEFVAILYGTSFDVAVKQTEALRRCIENSPLKSCEQTLSVTASFGIASLSPPDTASDSELILLADTMLYQAKNSGRNRVCHSQYHQDTNVIRLGVKK